MPKNSLDQHMQLLNRISNLRWSIPLLVALFGAGYVWFERIPTPDALLRALVFPLLVIPALCWIGLTWLNNAVHAAINEHRELALRDRELVVLNTIGEVAGQSLNLEAMLQVALERIVELLALPAGEICAFEGNRLVRKAHIGTVTTEEREICFQRDECVCAKCARSNEIIALKDLGDENSLQNVPCAHEGFRSIITVPLKSKDQVLGVILLASPQPNLFSPADQRILTAIASRVAMAVENAQLYKEAHRRALHLETASSLGQRITALLDVDAPLTKIVNLIRDKFGYYCAHIFLVDDTTNDLVLREASGPGADTLKIKGLRLKIGQEGIAGWVAHTGETLLCNDVSREPHYFRAELVPATQSELAVPLRAGNRVIGVLDVQSDRQDAFDKEDVSTLQILGNQVGVAVENARLFQETKRRYEAMIALHQTSLDIIARLDTTQLLQAVLQRGTQLLDAEGGGLALYDDERAFNYATVSYNTQPKWESTGAAPLGGLVGQVIQRHEPIIVNDYPHWEYRVKEYENPSRTRMIGVPLKWENHIVGAMVIMNSPKSKPFDEDDVSVLAQFADLASIAIKNAELHSQIKQFSQDLELQVDARTRELSTAKEEIAARSEQLRLLLEKTIRAQEEDRARIARDMHDDVVQLITSARWEIQTAEAFAGNDLKSAARDGLKAAHELLNEIEKQIRRAIYNLHPPVLDAVGLGSALQSYVDQFRKISGIACRLEINGNALRLPIQIESSIYHLVQEALANIAAHAEATESAVVFVYHEAMLDITVEDNGCGFDQEQWLQDARRDGSHLGLLSMQERAKSLTGSMQVESAAGCGTRLIFRIPIERKIGEWTPSAF
ncbi:MAG: GAF domain-containing protein [Chloroflexi bacterium]|nr:GAF domain-containing protein [Chloroflexota bacterium]